MIALRAARRLGHSLRSQRGGIAFLMVLGFMALSVPLISAALGLASTANLDSHSKKQILRRQYCALGVGEYVNYLLSSTVRWYQWWVDHPSGQETIDFCGESVTLFITFPPQPPIETLSEPPSNPGQIPILSAYNNRRLQTLKTIEPLDVAAPTTRTYTISATNRSSVDVNLNKIHDQLPQGFTYLGPTSGVTIAAPSVSGSHLTWDLATLNLPALTPGESRSLTFDVSVSGALPEGNYCNDAWSEQGGTQTRSGKTAKVVIGSPGNNICRNEPAAVLVAKTVSSATGLSVAVLTPPASSYSMVIGYTIQIDNIGTGPLTMTRVRDLLPLGYCFVANSATLGGVPLADPKVNIPKGQGKPCPDPDDRQQLTWDLTDQIPSGGSRTLVFNALAVVKAGDHWSDLLVTFNEIVGDDLELEPVYTWPTSLVTVRDVFNVEAQIGDTNQVIGNYEVWVGSDSGTIVKWTVE